MPESGMSPGRFVAVGVSMRSDEPRSAPQRELHQFISAVDDLILRSNSTHFLTEIWLDELARMDCTSSSTVRNWRLVSLAASERLIQLLVESQLRDSQT